MSTYRCRAGAVLLLAPLVLAACAAGDKPSAPAPLDAGGTVVAPSQAAAKLGVPFRNGSFEVTVTKVETGVRQLNISDAARSSGLTKRLVTPSTASKFTALPRSPDADASTASRALDHTPP